MKTTYVIKKKHLFDDGVYYRVGVLEILEFKDEKVKVQDAKNGITFWINFMKLRRVIRINRKNQRAFLKNNRNVELNQFTLKAIFLSMMYVAREEGEKVDEKYYELEDLINEQNDISLTDMIDNLENVYKLIEKEKVEI